MGEKKREETGKTYEEGRSKKKSINKILRIKKERNEVTRKLAAKEEEEEEERRRRRRIVHKRK